MKFFIAIWSYFFRRKSKRSKLLAPLIDPRFVHPGYKDLPPALLAAVGDPARLHYPPYDVGYPGLLSGEFCMRRFQAKLQSKLKRQSGLSPEEYKNYLEPILVTYAELVHLLPASQHHHHNNMGGLLRHGLETACFMLDWMVLTKFDHELTPGEASMRLRRWYVAGIIAALFHDAGKPLTDVRVMSFEGDKEWFMGRLTIHEWAIANNITRYFITWIKGRDGQHTTETTRLIGKHVTSDLEEWLVEGGRDIWNAMLRATSGKPGPLTEAVKVADSRSVKADRQLCSSANGEPTETQSIERRCIDAIRYLIDDGQWTINQPGSRLWKTPDGFFLAWSAGSAEIIQHVTQDTASGFPRDENSLLVAMSERELIEKDENGSMIWFVAPHVLRKNDKAPSLRCIKLKRPAEIFLGVFDELSPVSATIGRGVGAREYHAPCAKEENTDAPQQSNPELPAPVQKDAHVAMQSTPLVIPPRFTNLLSTECADYLRTNPVLGSRLLSEFEQNPQIRECQNRVFLPLTGLITEDDVPTLTDAGWLSPNLANDNGELTRVQRGETGVILNTKLSLIFCRLTGAQWHPRCLATLPEEMLPHVMQQVITLEQQASEELGRGVKTYSLSFWARDKYQKANNLTTEEAEQLILYGLEAVKVSNQRKYFFTDLQIKA